jgi:hypothetical protein
MFDMAARRRREMREAAKCTGITVALEEPPTCADALLRIVINACRQLRIARLQWRMDQVAGGLHDV